MPEVRSPTVRRRELGALLRALRNEKGLTVEQVAERLLCSPSKVSRMETGHGIATPRDIRDLCELYDVTDATERDRYMTLARESKKQAWWHSYDLHQFAEYVGLEADAASIQRYQSSVIPGLLQTPDYARAMHEITIPPLAPEEIDDWLEVRIKRQRRLTENPELRLWVVLDEAVLHRAVGGPDVMAAQLDHLIEMTNRPNVTVQVIPYDAGAHPAMDSTFSLLDFTGPVPSVVYVEGLIGRIYLDNQQDLTRYRQVFELLCAAALAPQQTIELIAKVEKQHRRAST